LCRERQFGVRRVRQITEGGHVKKVLYIDMDNVLVDFRSAIPCLAPEVVEQYVKHLDDVPGIFALMDPMPGAVPAFKELRRLFDAYVLSTAPWKNPSAWSDKLVWVQDNLGRAAYKRLILTHHKDLNSGAFLIDDRRKHGVARFDGEFIHFGTKQFPDWPRVVEYLRPRA
jgi:5'-nucleotidase